MSLCFVSWGVLLLLSSFAPLPVVDLLVSEGAV